MSLFYEMNPTYNPKGTKTKINDKQKVPYNRFIRVFLLKKILTPPVNFLQQLKNGNHGRLEKAGFKTLKKVKNPYKKPLLQPPDNPY